MSRVAIYSAGAGGNYILDATNFLEFLPKSHAWLVTFLAVWWAVGYTITGLLAWAFMSNYSCPEDYTVAQCTSADNMGWRYLHFTCGSLVIVLSVLRLLVIKMVQTPKWLISQNRDEEAFNILADLSQKYDRPLKLELESITSQGRVLHTDKSVWSALRLRKHFAGLFEGMHLVILIIRSEPC
jgi:MFS family permease